MARPMPFVPPVTIAVLPLRSMLVAVNLRDPLCLCGEICRNDINHRGTEDHREPRRRIERNYFSFSRSRSFTILGLAFPFEAFITCPTKKPNSASLPERYCSN